MQGNRGKTDCHPHLPEQCLTPPGESVEIARDGVPVARLVRIERPSAVGHRFFAARGSLAGRITLADDFEFTDAELQDMLNEPT